MKWYNPFNREKSKFVVSPYSVDAFLDSQTPVWYKPWTWRRKRPSLLSRAEYRSTGDEKEDLAIALDPVNLVGRLMYRGKEEDLGKMLGVLETIEQKAIPELRKAINLQVQSLEGRDLQVLLEGRFPEDSRLSRLDNAHFNVYLALAKLEDLLYRDGKAPRAPNKIFLISKDTA